MKIKNKTAHQSLKPETGLDAFTLVELIVVVTILAILSTIGFVSYSSYLIGVRDTNRISNMKALSDWLELYRTKFTLPLPEDSVDVKVNGSVIAYQWYAWANVLESIEFSNGWKDPKFEMYYSYYLSKDKKYFQLMWFLEEEDNLQVKSNLKIPLSNFPPKGERIAASITKQTSALDYSILYPTVYGKKLGILTDLMNTPIQEISTLILSWSVDLTWINDMDAYIVHFDDDSSITNSWYLLAWTLENIIANWVKYKAPETCDTWFIPVPWNLDLWQPWFCVAQYEMTYADADTPNSCIEQHTTTCTEATNNVASKTDWNTVRYEIWKTIVSQAWKYPIANITQPQAITACESLWKWYHLITNTEWMSLARNTELEAENWTGDAIWAWYLHNWVSNDTNRWCNAKWWNTETRNYATKTWEWEITCNLKRKHKLSNGEYIWDLSWNVREHVNWTNNISSTDWVVSTWNACGWSNWYSWVWDDWAAWWTCSYSNWYTKSIYWPLWDYNANNGVGRIYSSASTNRIFLRGASAGDSSYVGVFTLHLGRNSASQARAVGFRCAR